MKRRRFFGWLFGAAVAPIAAEAAIAPAGTVNQAGSDLIAKWAVSDARIKDLDVSGIMLGRLAALSASIEALPVSAAQTRALP